MPRAGAALRVAFQRRDLGSLPGRRRFFFHAILKRLDGNACIRCFRGLRIEADSLEILLDTVSEGFDSVQFPDTVFRCMQRRDKVDLHGDAARIPSPSGMRS
jgi:hypothetical protein